MKDLALRGDKRVTLKQIATATGAAYRTVAAYAQKAGWTRNGEKTLLDEKQATIIIEAMKQAKNSPDQTLLASMQAVKTDYSDEFRLALMYKQIGELNAKAAELEHGLRLKAQKENDQLRHENADLHSWLRVRNEELINSGLALSDRDDMLALYGRRG